jgi:hypothetical protein
MASRRSGPGGPDFPLPSCASRRATSRPPRVPPTARHRSCSSSNGNTGALAKPWVGMRRQRHCAALRTAERMAARAQRALQHLTRVDCSSATNEVSGASFDAGHEPEHRKGSGAQRRTPHTSAGAHPPAALHAHTSHVITRKMTTTPSSSAATARSPARRSGRSGCRAAGSATAGSPWSCARRSAWPRAPARTAPCPSAGAAGRSSG